MIGAKHPREIELTTFEMVASDATPATSHGMRIAGWALSGVTIAFMAFDATIKLLDLPVVVESSQKLGLPTYLDRPIGLIELVCLLLYIWPRTAMLGAILFTAIFGGAIATHLRLDDPLFTHTFFGVYLGLFAWGGLWFRSAALRRLIPFRH